MTVPPTQQCNTTVTCTSLLYCDWRKRKNRRQRKRERSLAAQATSSNVDPLPMYRSWSGGKSEGSSKRSGEEGYEHPPPIRSQRDTLQIVGGGGGRIDNNEDWVPDTPKSSLVSARKRSEDGAEVEANGGTDAAANDRPGLSKAVDWLPRGGGGPLPTPPPLEGAASPKVDGVQQQQRRGGHGKCQLSG